MLDTLAAAQAAPGLAVSNPFRTGRYCAAVALEHARGQPRVSNPFRTGRYCADFSQLHERNSQPEFQTPSERGGIVLTYVPIVYRLAAFRFKPLQNGAVLCWYLRRHEGDDGWGFQTPSERGGIVLKNTMPKPPSRRRMFQTPSERGGIVLNHWSSRPKNTMPKFQTPSERGGIVLKTHGRRRSPRGNVSNPFRTGRYCAEGRIRDDPGLAHGDGVGCHQ